MNSVITGVLLAAVLASQPDEPCARRDTVHAEAEAAARIAQPFDELRVKCGIAARAALASALSVAEVQSIDGAVPQSTLPELRKRLSVADIFARREPPRESALAALASAADTSLSPEAALVFVRERVRDAEASARVASTDERRAISAGNEAFAAVTQAARQAARFLRDAAAARVRADELEGICRAATPPSSSPVGGEGALPVAEPSNTNSVAEAGSPPGVNHLPANRLDALKQLSLELAEKDEAHERELDKARQAQAERERRESEAAEARAAEAAKRRATRAAECGSPVGRWQVTVSYGGADTPQCAKAGRQFAKMTESHVMDIKPSNPHVGFDVWRSFSPTPLFGTVDLDRCMLIAGSPIRTTPRDGDDPPLVTREETSLLLKGNTAIGSRKMTFRTLGFDSWECSLELSLEARRM